MSPFPNGVSRRSSLEEYHFAIGLFWFGWTGYRKEIHWIAPTLSGLFTGFGILSIFLQSLNYLVDAYLMLYVLLDVVPLLNTADCCVLQRCVRNCGQHVPSIDCWGCLPPVCNIHVRRPRLAMDSDAPGLRGFSPHSHPCCLLHLWCKDPNEVEFCPYEAKSRGSCQ